MKNSGTEIVLSVPKVTMRSSQVPGCIAAHSPSAIDNGIETSATRPAIDSVLPRRPPIRLEMLAPPALEVPRSPVAMSPSQPKYWMYSGWSMPSSLRSAASVSGVALWPSTICATSPGSQLVIRNTIIDTTTNVARPIPTRCQTIRIIMIDFLPL